MAKKSTSSTLVGNWKVIGCQLNTVWLPYPIFKNFVYTFPDTKKFTLAWADLTFPKYVGGFPKSESGKISIDKNQIDLIPESGPYAKQTFKGIFELDHDILKANFAFPNHPRPKTFNAEKGQVYEIWQRIP